ncbi:MAG: aminotransferase class V-fold PLP-dependent enzyme [Victivallales bacterium]|nr:aminotransferase class V-fold PLP-dependent enzyme [Victivallales bacterium]
MNNYRNLFDKEALEAVTEVFNYSWEKREDFGYQGYFEEKYTSYFSEFMGGGFTDAVCSGSVAVYLALNALDIPPNSEVIISPVTDPGSVSAVILLGFNPVICDAKKNSFNLDFSQFKKAVTEKTKAAVLTHLGGLPIEEIKAICEYARKKNIKIVEDGSQAHGAEVDGQKIGTFGDISAFSTMYRKNHASGGCGGLVFTKDENLYWKVRSLADRGKPFYKKDFNQKDPGTFLGPALNFNSDEISCAIGLYTLKKLPEIIIKRKKIVDYINDNLKLTAFIKGQKYSNNITPSYYFHTLYIENATDEVKNIITNALIKDNIPINPDYRFVVSEWTWVKKYTESSKTPNAVNFKKKSFNLLFHENISHEEVDKILKTLINY